MSYVIMLKYVSPQGTNIFIQNNLLRWIGKNGMMDYRSLSVKDFQKLTETGGMYLSVCDYNYSKGSFAHD